MTSWIESRIDGVTVFAPPGVPDGFLVAFSGRGVAPSDEPSPTAYLARRFAQALSLDGVPIVRATQVHGRRGVRVAEAPDRGAAADAGECDVLATTLPGVALAVQTADCVPIVLTAPGAVAAAHAGWRGTAVGAASAAVAELVALGARPDAVRAWLGPSIGPCCYEVGGEVAAQFAGEFVRRSCGAGFLLDLAAVNRAQLVAAGLDPGHVSAHPGCTRCGGDAYASYRRDGARAGRMIALGMRLPAS